MSGRSNFQPTLNLSQYKNQEFNQPWQVNGSFLTALESLHKDDKPTSITKYGNLIAPTNTRIIEQREAVLEYLQSIRKRGKKYSFEELVNSGLIDDNGSLLISISASRIIALLKLARLNVSQISLTGCSVQHRGVVYRYDADIDSKETIKRICINVNPMTDVQNESQIHDGAILCSGGKMCKVHCCMDKSFVGYIVFADVFITNYSVASVIDEVEYESWRTGKLIAYKDNELKIIRSRDYFIQMFGLKRTERYVTSGRLARV